MNKTAKPEASGIKDHFQRGSNQINKNNNYYYIQQGDNSTFSDYKYSLLLANKQIYIHTQIHTQKECNRNGKMGMTRRLEKSFNKAKGFKTYRWGGAVHQ